jgi:hypothetical protein
MPVGRKKVFLTKLTDVSTSDKDGVGTFRREGPNEYFYCKGVASVAAGTPVTIDESYAVTVLATGTTPPYGHRVAIAQAAVVASNWGWFQVAGQYSSAVVAASAAADGIVYNSKSTAGTLSTTSSGNLLINGIVLTAAESSSVAPVTLIHPWIGA